VRGLAATRLRLVRWSTVLVGVVIVAGCDAITDPLPRTAEPFTPPAVFARWWPLTQACSSTSGDFTAIHWYRVPGYDFMLGKKEVGGYFDASHNRIVLADMSIEEGSSVRHEMLHALLRVGGHPRSEFLEKCASMVTCQGQCVEDAGHWRPPRADFAVLPPESLSVASHAILLPSEPDGQRWLTLQVTIENMRARAVLVAAPGDAAKPSTFSFDLRGPTGGISGGEIASDSSTLFFQPFESKRWLFEFRVAADLSAVHVTPGSYLVRGGYARRWAAYDTVEIVP
jgi:hypothetical protein